MAIIRTRSDQKREAIIVAAKQAFQEFGVSGTSMDKLAEMANVSKRTVYNHFSTKEELVMYLIKEQWKNALVNNDIVYQPSRPLHEQLAALIRAEIDFVTEEEHLELARVAIGHFFYEPEKLKDEVAHLRSQETAMHRWLKAAQTDNRIVLSDLQQVVSELESLVKGQCFWPQLMKIEPPMSAQKKQLIADSAATLVLSCYEKR